MATRPLDVDRSATVLTPAATPRGAWPVYVGVGASSAAVIVFEIVLTRIFAVSQFYHFAFMTVSLALLGFGASGTALTVFPRLGRGGPRRWATLALAQAVTTLGAYLVINRLPFDSFSIAWDRRQIFYLVGYYLALAVPFFFGGAVIGTLLTGWDQPHSVPSHRIYAASLVGSGTGALLALGGVSQVGGEGVVVLAALCALAAATVFATSAPIRRRGWVAAILGVVLVVVWAAGSSALDVRLSPYKALSAVLRFPDTEVVSTDWNAASRVDLVTSESIRSLPGLSFAYLGSPPPQDGVTFDADDLSPIPRVEVAEADFVPHLLGSLPFSLRPGAEALVLQPRGGLDVLVGLASGVESIVAVEPNELAVAAAGAGALSPYADPRVEVVVEEPRSYVERTTAEFDLIDLALTAPYRPVSSGAYSLAEDYSLTVEAFESYLDRLRPGGVLAAMRWLQTPPSEETRLIALAAEATRRIDADPEQAVVALRGYSTVLVMVQPDGFSAADLEAVESFAEGRRFDLVVAPGLASWDANRYNVLPKDDYFTLAVELVGEEPEALYDGYEFAIAPPTDDHPFFGHFFKWDQASAVLDSLGRSWQPFGGAGYFVLMLLLAVVAIAAVALIVTPLVVARLRRGGEERLPVGLRSWTAAYFGFLGVGFLFVEIPIVQRYILLVGRPTTSLALVLFVLLLGSGLGALSSRRLPWRPMAVALTIAVLILPWLLTGFTEVALSAPLWLRMAAGGAVLFPLGFAMGTMFPKGLARLEASAPQLVPWAWGVNGVMSVISAVASALLALTFGFTAVILLGAACYGACALLVPRSGTSEQRALSPRPG
jgi:hypothetical protein